MRYVITGSLGNISQSLTQKLISAGHEVVIVSSQLKRREQIQALGARAEIGDSMNSLATSAKTEFAAIGRSKIAYRRFGNGVPLFVANRPTGILDTWDPLFLDALAEQYSVIVYDYPGIGDSEGELPLNMTDLASGLIGLADHLKIDRFNMLGWSYGGWVTQYVGFLYPSRVLKMVVLGGTPVGKNDTPTDPLFLERASKPVKDFEDNMVMYFEPRFEESRAAAKASFQRIAARLDTKKIPATKELIGRYFAANQGLIQDERNFRAIYSTLQIPLLAISGDHDISSPVENWFPLLRKASTLQLIIMPGAGHASHHQTPELTGAYIREFLKVRATGHQ